MEIDSVASSSPMNGLMSSPVKQKEDLNQVYEDDAEATYPDQEDTGVNSGVNGTTDNLDNDSLPSKSKEKVDRVTQLPLSRIKHIMKLDPDVSLVNQDASYLITKAAELFINFLSKESYAFTLSKKKKIVSRQDVDNAINTDSPLFFLQGCLEN